MGERVAMSGLDTEFVDHPDAIEFRSQLHQASQHELKERLVLDAVETQPSPAARITSTNSREA